MNLDSDYRAFLRRGYVEATGISSASPSSSEAREEWFRQQALPWFESLVARGTSDGLPVYCYLGSEEYSPQECPCALFLHPWTGMTAPWAEDLCLDRLGPGDAYVDVWRELAGHAWTSVSSRSDAELAADYTRLREHGHVAALRLGRALTNRTYKERKKWHEEMKGWQRERFEPWWAELVKRARADGLTVLCTPLHDFDSIAGLARLLDERTGLELGAAERFITGSGMRPVIERSMDEARANG